MPAKYASWLIAPAMLPEGFASTPRRREQWSITFPRRQTWSVSTTPTNFFLKLREAVERWEIQLKALSVPSAVQQAA